MPEVEVMSNENEREPVQTDCTPVQLQPFIHQVGGHTSMLCFDDTTVCKPLNTREYYFYMDIPKSLKEYTAEFRGIIEVELHEDSDGYITLMGYPKVKGQKPTEHVSPSSSGSGSDTDSPDLLRRTTVTADNSETHGIRLLRSGSIEVSTQTDEVFHTSDPQSGSSLKTACINPWSLKCHKRHLSQMRSTGKGPRSCKFILLENVAAKFQYPCILDLKMGTRQHGDEVSEAKKQRHMRKCEITTSSSLGLRICGMQVYQANTGKYICHNKYFGRSLTKDSFKQSLHQFLHNGCESRRSLIGPIVQRLHELSHQIALHETFRFYSSSLLVMYDGSYSRKEESNASGVLSKEKDSSEAQKVDVRMIDFAHSTHSGFQEDQTIHEGPDEGYLFGLENLIQLFNEMRS